MHVFEKSARQVGKRTEWHSLSFKGFGCAPDIAVKGHNYVWKVLCSLEDSLLAAVSEADV
jgi:hypothetical protein